MLRDAEMYIYSTAAPESRIQANSSIGESNPCPLEALHVTAQYLQGLFQLTCQFLRLENHGSNAETLCFDYLRDSTEATRFLIYSLNCWFDFSYLLVSRSVG
jgi:hypothetical protein